MCWANQTHNTTRHFFAVYAISKRTETRQNQPLKNKECEILRCGSGGKAGAKRWTACGGMSKGKSRVPFCSCLCVGQIKYITLHGIFHAVYAIFSEWTHDKTPLKSKKYFCGVVTVAVRWAN